MLPKSSSANFSSSPLNSSSAKSATSHGSIGEAFRHFDKNYTISSHKPLVDPYGSFAPARGKGHGRVANEGKKMERRAPPPAGEPGSWRGRPGVKGWTGAEESTELGAADETPVEEDGDAEDAAVVNSHEGDENEKVEPVEDEDGYEEERVEFAGREGWVVSRDCAADAEAYGLSRRV